eukprot:CAMPEP_0119107290 /NCGR_PEP_ID=MMETSP1180-20130426/9621_1 /TAXON_ID=3052 ORGANISM="Chlamydomonas cf sp, Strain CCMP681" /NCGR_SAMPLE_ID=MMETSP1180 /ASSEMBLY_ACC=CAM_ASM_000741 /LENGTH=84 /DNA_ID=CAMNT_0007092757 /DNA_START=394 /DNA_END=651 /DNA_ORIENTATION=-
MSQSHSDPCLKFTMSAHVWKKSQCIAANSAPSMECDAPPSLSANVGAYSLQDLVSAYHSVPKIHVKLMASQTCDFLTSCLCCSD